MIPFLDIRKINTSFQPELGQAILNVVDSGQYVRGQELRDFEERYAAFIGAKNCVGVGNGFDALRLVLMAWRLRGDIREGDEVIVPSNTYIASILAITENRLRPVLAEPDINTFVVPLHRIEEKVTARTRAVMIVHLYGRNAMDSEIRSVADRYKLKILEDNAQATGCALSGKRTGSLGDAAAHSFFPTKNLGALGDGGAVTTDDDDLAEMVRTLGNYGSHKKGLNRFAGVNSRLDEVQAATLNVKLSRLDADNSRRQDIARRYHEKIRSSHLVPPRLTDDPREHVWHLFVVRSEYRDALQRHLAAAGVETLIHYPMPPHLQPAYKEMNELRFPVSEQVHREVLSLPLHPALTDAEIDYIADAVNRFQP